MNIKKFKHPECLKSEMFIKNVSVEEFNTLPYLTKRLGNKSYNGLGNELDSKNWFPFFIDEKEFRLQKLSLIEFRRKLA